MIKFIKIAAFVLLMLPILGGKLYSQGTRYLDDVFLSYNTESGEYQKDYKYLLFSPAGDTVKKRPVIIVLHAGGGKLEDVSGWCIDFVKKGYVCITAEYKLTVGDFNPSEQKQAVAQIYWLNYWIKQNSDRAGLKAKKIFVMGTSAGGITALQSGMALNDRFTDFFSGYSIPDTRNLYIIGTASMSGAAIPEFNSIINTGDPPNFFYNGMKDLLIPYKAAELTYSLQILSGIPSGIVLFPDKGHKLESHDFILADLTLRFYSILKPKAGQ